MHTVQFSNHTGYGEWRGIVFEPQTVADIITGIEERGVLPECSAVLSGYQGAQAIGEVVLDTVARVKAVNPAAVYCADPVMGDVGRGFYVQDGIPEFMRDRIVPAADLLTPNQFELEYLAGVSIRSMADLLAAVDVVRRQGPSTVLVTSVQTDQTPADSVQMVAVGDQGAFQVTTPLMPLHVSGCGDATAAIFLARLATESLANALAITADSVYGVIEATHESGSRELQLISAQDAIAHPQSRFEVERLPDRP